MTIGDEKVVRRWTPEICEDEQDGQIVAGMDPYTEGHYVLHSAYAELAADRDLWRSMATFEGKVSASVLDDLHTTQAQLAELRGRVLEIDALMRKDIAEFGGCLKLVNRLRALAAADGGGG